MSWHTLIEGGKKEVDYQDQFGNEVSLVSHISGVNNIEITGSGDVEIENLSGMSGQHSGFMPLWYYTRSTELTRPGLGVKRIGDRLKKSSEDALPQLHTLMNLIAEQVAYQLETTHVKTSAEDSLKLGTGVCQDHAHIFISVARLLGFPARYVSGYLLMAAGETQNAGHAWAEAYIDGLGWVGFDVSNRICPDDRYIRVATGLDYSDAAPISGMNFGVNVELLDVSVQVQQ